MFTVQRWEMVLANIDIEASATLRVNRESDSARMHQQHVRASIVRKRRCCNDVEEFSRYRYTTCNRRPLHIPTSSMRPTYPANFAPSPSSGLPFSERASVPRRYRGDLGEKLVLARG
jgi:hypothetical protein